MTVNGSAFLQTFPHSCVFHCADSWKHALPLNSFNNSEQNGDKIPDDISIIGYDDIPFSSFISLTTIAQPDYEIGRNSMLVLVDLITKRRKPPQKIILRDSLAIRRSCKRI